MITRFEDFVQNIASIQKSLQKIKTREMADFGLKGSHVMVLHALTLHEDGLTASELSRSSREDKAAVSRIVTDLSGKKLIHIEDNPQGNRYRAVIYLTDEGKRVTEAMEEKIKQAVCDVAKGYSHEEQTVFRKILKQLADNLEDAATNVGRK